MSSIIGSPQSLILSLSLRKTLSVEPLCYAIPDADTEALGNRLDSLKRRLIIQTRGDSVKALTALLKAKARNSEKLMA